jgi:hypothetical protein
MAGSRERADDWRGGPLELDLEAYGSLYDEGGARGTSGAAGTDSCIAPEVGGGIGEICRRRFEAPLEMRLEGAVATVRAVLLGIVEDMAGSWTGTKVGCASTGRRYEEPRFCGKLSGALRRFEFGTREAWRPLLFSILRRGHVAKRGDAVLGGTCQVVVHAQIVGPMRRGTIAMAGLDVVADWIDWRNLPKNGWRCGRGAECDATTGWAGVNW